MTRAGKGRPLRRAGELILDTRGKLGVAVPEVPNIVRDAPHLRVLAYLRGFFQCCRSGRKAQNDWSPCLAECLTHHANLIALLGMIGNAIALQKVHAPTAVLLA